MATTVWNNGAATGDLNTAGNWSNGIPGAGDIAIFNGTESASVTSSAAALTALTLAEVRVEAGYSGNLGDAGTPLELSATKFSFYGSGKLFFNNGSTGTTLDLIIETPSGAVQLGDNAGGLGITRISLLACRQATLLSTLDTTTDLFISPGVSVDIQGANTITNAHVSAGATVTCRATITNLFNGGATWTQMSDGLAITNMYLHAGSMVKYLGITTIAYAVVHPGATLDFTGDTREKTLTLLRSFPGARILRTSRAAPTIATGEFGLRDVMPTT